nr:IQ motif, EF-hand binding site, P-loop containing nucleoside triphosphate hydrolase [Tanacetum cinerariifolium]
MFYGAPELKGNGSFSRKEATETVACSESTYTMDDVHACRMAENSGARFATTVPRSLDSEWIRALSIISKRYNSLFLGDVWHCPWPFTFYLLLAF